MNYAVAAAWPPEDRLDAETWNAAQLAFARNEPVGFETDILPRSNWHFIPLRTQRGSFGVVGIGKGASGDRSMQKLAHCSARLSNKQQRHLTVSSWRGK